MGKLISIFVAILLVASVASCGKPDKPKEEGPFKLGGGKQPISDFEPAPEKTPTPADTGGSSGIIDVVIEGDGDDEITPADDQPVTTDDQPSTAADLPPEPLGPGEHTLRIDLDGDCWVEVDGPRGDPFKGLLKQGDSKSFGPQRYFLITLGAPSTAEVFYDGKLLYGGDKPSAPKMYFALPKEASVHLKKPEDKPEPDTVTAAKPVTPQTPPPTPAPRADGMHTLRIDVAEECWVSVASGEETILRKLLQKGDSRTFEPRAGFDITIGKPEVTTVYLDGKEVFGPKAGYAKSLSFKLPGEYVAATAPPEETQPSPPGRIHIEVQPEPAPEPIPTRPAVEPDEQPSASYQGWIETGMWSMAMQNYDDAIENFEQAYEIEPNYAEVNRLLGKAHRGAGNIDTAIDYLSTALHLKYNDTGSLLEMAYAYEDKGDNTAAITFFERYLALEDDEIIAVHVEEMRGD